MNNTVDEYINGLEKIYKEKKGEDIKFISHTSKNDINLIKKNYPDVPNEYIKFLKKTDGIIKKNEEDFFHSPVMFSIWQGHTTYAMCGIKEILKHAERKKETLAEMYPWFLEASLDDIESAAEEIDLYIPIGERLLFADDGTFQLYIDLNPSPVGKVGQIIAYFHDPDSYSLICNSFSELLKESINTNFEYFFL